jgi:hypothetical protein
MNAVLDATIHAPLIRDAARIVREANIPMAMLSQSMVGRCSPIEVEYIKKLRQHPATPCYGLVLHGTRHEPSVLDRFSMMAAACLRNYISAKVMTVQDVIDALDSGTMPKPTALFIPNFCIGSRNGGRIAEWETPLLLSLLYNRQSETLQTIVYVEDMSLLESQYGTAYKQHFASTNFWKTDGKNDE